MPAEPGEQARLLKNFLGEQTSCGTGSASFDHMAPQLDKLVAKLGKTLTAFAGRVA
jgi:hypothetical protein